MLTGGQIVSAEQLCHLVVERQTDSPFRLNASFFAAPRAVTATFGVNDAP
jgi:hypothetical protein